MNERADQADAVAELLRLQASKAASTAQVRHEMARGLRYTHYRANANTNQLIQLMSTVQAATALLAEKGLLDRQALEQRASEAAGSIRQDFQSKGMGVQIQASDTSKYALESSPRIDCENRIPLCQAACCKMHFALSREDLEEGKIRWDVGQPYVIAQGADGWCVHLDRATRGCGCYAARPLVCRTYDCRNDTRIWLDFERRIVNPQIRDPQWPRQETARAPAGAGKEPEPHSVAEAPAARRRLLRLWQWLPSHPDLVRLGGCFLSSYGVFLSLAFALASLVWLLRVGPVIRGSRGWLFLPAVVAVSYAGSRLLRVIEGALDRLFRHARADLSGHALYGGLIAAVAFSAAWWRTSPGTAWLVDQAAPAICVGLAVARLGCFGSGCCIGCPSAHGPVVTYTHPLSKAVAYYGMGGVPLVPIQLYEGLLAGAAAIGFLLLPSTWYGNGRAFGMFLVVLSLMRVLVLPFRYRAPGVVHASSLITGILHAAFATLGTGLVVAGSGTSGIPTIASASSPVALPATIAVSFTLVLFFFGLHKRPLGAAGTHTKGDRP